MKPVTCERLGLVQVLTEASGFCAASQPDAIFSDGDDDDQGAGAYHQKTDD